MPPVSTLVITPRSPRGITYARSDDEHWTIVFEVDKASRLVHTYNVSIYDEVARLITSMSVVAKYTKTKFDVTVYHDVQTSDSDDSESYVRYNGSSNVKIVDDVYTEDIYMSDGHVVRMELYLDQDNANNSVLFFTAQTS